MAAIILGYAIPRYYDLLIPVDRRGEGDEPTIAMQTKGELAGRPIADLVNAERGDGYSSGSDREKVHK